MAGTIWLAADTLDYPTGGGHFWSYLNWALGSQANGYEVVWMEQCRRGAASAPLAQLSERLGEFGQFRTCFYLPDGSDTPGGEVSVQDAAAADLLLNLSYDLPPALHARFRRSALLDIDPGMTQAWIAAGDVRPPEHDIYLTIGEGVARRNPRIPQTSMRWQYLPPCVAVEHWRSDVAPSGGAYSTVTHWWGEGSFLLPDGRVIDNSKRASFLEYLDLPQRTGIPLELAVTAADLEDDAALLQAHGWSIADPARRTSTPQCYRSYVSESRGEFSCAKPAYVELATGWLSDRTVCYLAAGRPAVIQHTGPCGVLDDVQGEGIFRFADPAQAAEGLRAAERDHGAQCASARTLAEERFDAQKVVRRLLELSLA